MRHLDRYTPEICSQLRQIAEQRSWRTWDKTVEQDELLEDLELTYHLHAAAEAMGARAGLPAMPNFPIGFIDSEGILDPIQFIKSFTLRRPLMRAWNQSDNSAKKGAAA
ncbi:MAG TPA: hypothetical protein VFA65_12115 [Bryobacteraceae bacterium]|nr:hypothetical protein [Bryobacteraceae bacterium]